MQAQRTASTVAETIERTITQRILRATYAPGTRLKPVRSLAAEFDVTPPTIQRVIARLEARGLVKARQGSGVVVNHLQRDAGPDLLPDWFEVLADDPPAAAELLSGVLAMRRSLARSLFERHLDRVTGVADRVEELVAGLAGAQTTEEIARIDLEIAANVIDATGELAYVLVFNAIRRSIFRVPHMVMAMYGDVDYTHANLQAFVRIVLSPGPAAGRAADIERLMAEGDRRTVKRYEDRLQRSLAAGP